MPVGEPVSFSGAERPQRVTLEGRYVTVRPLDPAADGAPLYEAVKDAPELWDYLPYGPFESEVDHRADLERLAASEDPLFYAFVKDGQAVGRGSLMRIVPEHGVIEVGHLLFTPRLQRTPAGTEVIYLLGEYVFETLGYRRFEWKCNALNEASKRAAERYGFLYEGTFAQHMVIKGRNRDTAWFSITDRRWPEVKAGFQRWLDPANFDLSGNQVARLDDLRGG